MTESTTQKEKSEDPKLPEPERVTYTKTKRSVYSSQHDVAEAWASGKYPLKNQGTNWSGKKYAEVSTSNDNFRGVQFGDGSGRLIHYSTTEAIRTRTGLIISNQQCWSRGFAHCTTPPGVDARLPLSDLPDFLDADHDIYDIVAVREGDNGHKVVDIEGADYSIFIGRDPSLRTREVCIMVLSEEERDMPIDEIPNLLMPGAVREAVESEGYKIVSSDEYRKTKFMDPNEETIERENLKKVTQAWGRDHYKNHKSYLEKYQGKAIVRQGEWFFIPGPDLEPRPELDSDARDILGNHKPQRQGTEGARAPLPTECPNCDVVDINLGAMEDSSAECRNCGAEIPKKVYVRGNIGHRNNDHHYINLGDTWHRAVSHNREVTTVSLDGPGGGRRD